ncbi:MAG: TetR/AcrR family transcriptional regulator [Nitriliruptoraceae bacterium]
MKDPRARRRSGRTRPHPLAPEQLDSGAPRGSAATDGPSRPAAATEADTPGPGPASATPSSPARRGGRPRDRAREAELVAAAIGLVEEAGLPALTMDALASRAGASKATLYRRWPDRHALAIALVEPLTSSDGEVPDSGSVREDLAAVLHTLDAALQGPLGALLVGLAAEAHRNPGLRVPIDRALSVERTRVRQVLERGVGRGELPRRADLDLLATSATSICVERALVGSPPLTRPDASALADRWCRQVAGSTVTG